jgi:hypothetical protein
VCVFCFCHILQKAGIGYAIKTQGVLHYWTKCKGILRSWQLTAMKGSGNNTLI